MFFVFIFLVDLQQTDGARSDYKCHACRLVLFIATLVSKSLVIDHIVSLVGTEKLDHVYSSVNSRRR